MTSPVITNSLLRVDGIAGLPPSPFERPNEKMDFFVLELGLHDHLEGWCAYAAEALKVHAESLQKMRAAGASLTLFVECASILPVLRLPAIFLRLLADAGISLECSRGIG